MDSLRGAGVCAAGVVFVTAGCAAIARRRGPRSIAYLLLVADTALCWFFLPRDQTVGFISAVLFWVFPLAGNIAAFETRLRGKWDGFGAYVFDVCTLSSNRLTSHLARPTESPRSMLVRGLFLGAAVAVSVEWLRGIPTERIPFWGWTAAKIAVVAIGAQALSDLTVAILWGRVPPSVRFPWLSASYQEFWGRRYNLWMHGFLFWLAREVLGLRRRGIALVVAAFAASGLAHEALSVMVLRRFTGWWIAFWAVQLGLTLLTMTAGRRIPRPVGRVLFFVTFVATTPLFFAVMDRAWPLFGPVTPEPW